MKCTNTNIMRIWHSVALDGKILEKCTTIDLLLLGGGY